MLGLQTLRGAREVELDDLGRARAHQEQGADARALRQQFVDHAVELFVRIGQTREIALANDGGAKAGLRKNHHAGRGLQQVRAGPRAHHQEERVLQFAMQPDDAGQPAEDFALAALA